MATKQVDGSAVTTTSTKNNGGVGKHVGTSDLLTDRPFFSGEKTVFASTVVDNSQEMNRLVLEQLLLIVLEVLFVGLILLLEVLVTPFCKLVLLSQVKEMLFTNRIIVSDLTTAIRDGR